MQTAERDRVQEQASSPALARFNHALALHRRGQLDAAVDGYGQTLALDPGWAMAHNNRANALQDLGQYEAALADCLRALALQPDLPEAHFNHGNALQALRRMDAALAAYDQAIRLRPDYAQAYCNRCVVLHDLKQVEAAVQSCQRATQLLPDMAEAHANLGIALQDAGQLQAAVQSYTRALQLQPDYPFLRGVLLHARLKACDWTGFDAALTDVLQRIAQGQPVAPPFVVLGLTDDPALQLRAAQAWMQAKCPPNPALGPLPQRRRAGKIRIGYFNAAFYGHANSYLLARVYECHDRSRFECIAFSSGPPAQDAMRARLLAAFDRFIDIRAMSDVEVAQLARTMEIDIAVDLRGYSQDARSGIFALRCAPVQVSYLGYPGTLAAPYIDYLIADATVVTPSSRPYLPERVAYLPHCYQPNDNTRAIAETTCTRQDLGLPADGFVYCCFNNNHKILPASFALWMRILHAVPNSVLWLLADNPDVVRNLRAEAQKRAVDPSRLVFAPRIEPSEHLARHRLADLALDTLPYNSHTTTSDALWAGLPLLTLPGTSFTARVAASVLQAIELPELIASSEEDYVAKALALALGASQLKAIREKLREKRCTAPLFDSERSTRALEAVFERMVDRNI